MMRRRDDATKPQFRRVISAASRALGTDTLYRGELCNLACIAREIYAMGLVR